MTAPIVALSSTTKEIGGYSLNLMEMREGKVAGQQFLGASVNYIALGNGHAAQIELLTDPRKSQRPMMNACAFAIGGKWST